MYQRGRIWRVWPIVVRRILPLAGERQVPQATITTFADGL